MFAFACYFFRQERIKGTNFFILKGVLEKIVLNLRSPVLNTIMRLLDIGQKNFAFTILQTGWQIMICLR